LLVLASSSPRRRALLEEIGARFEVVAREIDETAMPGESPRSYARRVAAAKARAVRLVRPGTWLLAADTVVEIDGDILGKPADAVAARLMLSRLSGRTHRVLTAVVLVAPDDTLHVDEVVTSRVCFREMDAHEIEAYVATREPFDKAGAYAVQGIGGGFVESIRGSYSSVVGLPLELVREALGSRDLLG
jgi:septum formation protein